VKLLFCAFLQEISRIKEKMRLKLLIFLSVSLSFATQAQKKKPIKKTPQTKIAKIDSTELLNRNQLVGEMQQAQDQIEASLTSKDKFSSQNLEKRFYDSYKLFLHAGEELTLEHSSDNFRVMLVLKTPTNKQEDSYDSKPFSGTSYNKFFYIVPTTGTYTLLATSMDAGQLGKYKIQKSIAAQNAVEAQIDPIFSNQFKALKNARISNFKVITDEKIKKDKKDKSVGQERFKTSFELVAGKPAIILQDNGGTTSNYKTTILETENEADAKQYFEKMKKQLQILVRGWTEQSNTDNNYGASTDKDIITLSISSEERKKKKVFYMVNFVYN